ncbi:hypothetical protein DRO97_02700 [Archaeoglobales archaeon]|nr:MAG: hypothetical protein DRO97_02700 [Archaeoglobales archaeon]
MRNSFCVSCISGDVMGTIGKTNRMDDKAVSPIIAIMLILAILVTSISVLASNWFPIVKKRAEIQHNKELTDKFLSIVTVYSTLNENRSSAMSIKLGGGDTFFSQTTTSSTLSVNQSGWINVSMECNDTSLLLTLKLFKVNLSIHNTLIPDQTFVFSEGGIKIFQYGKNITRLEPDIDKSIEFRDGVLYLRVDNLTSEPQEVSGNGIAFLRFKSNLNPNSGLYKNCTGSILVEDDVFNGEWDDVMIKLEENNPTVFSFNQNTNTLQILTQINVSLTIRDFDVQIQ